MKKPTTRSISTPENARFVVGSLLATTVVMAFVVSLHFLQS